MERHDGNIIIFPDAIVLKGLPIENSGWNGKYVKTEEMSHGYPVYRRTHHKYFIFFLDIIGTSILHNGRTWALRSDANYSCFDFGLESSIGKRNVLPYGRWSSEVIGWRGEVVRYRRWMFWV